MNITTQTKTDVNNCPITPCQNNGTCYDAYSSRTCVCAPGFTGADCSIGKTFDQLFNFSRRGNILGFHGEVFVFVFSFSFLLKISHNFVLCEWKSKLWFSFGNRIERILLQFRCLPFLFLFFPFSLFPSSA